MIKGCIFDFDGTLANTVYSIAYFANRALSDIGLPPISTDRYYTLVGNGAKVLMENMLKEVGGDPSLYCELRKTYDKYYADDFMHGVEIYDGILPMLNDLMDMDIKTAVLSNKPDDMTKCVCQTLFGTKIISDIYGQRENIPVKPNPEFALMIAKKWGIEPCECLFIGDTWVDMDTAANAKMTSVGVLWGFRDRDELSAHGADYIIDSPGEITEIIRKSK